MASRTSRLYESVKNITKMTTLRKRNISQTNIRTFSKVKRKKERILDKLDLHIDMLCRINTAFKNHIDQYFVSLIYHYVNTMFSLYLYTWIISITLSLFSTTVLLYNKMIIRYNILFDISYI